MTLGIMERLAAKVIWQDCHLTGNGFFKLSQDKQGKPGQSLHPYFGYGLLETEGALNGVDMIIGKQIGKAEWQAMAYHYPKQQNQTSQLLSTGMGLQASLTPEQPNKTYKANSFAKILIDKHKRHLITLGIRINRHTPIPHIHIQKIDQDNVTAQTQKNPCIDIDSILAKDENLVTKAETKSISATRRYEKLYNDEYYKEDIPNKCYSDNTRS